MVGNISRHIIKSDVSLEGYNGNTQPKFLKFHDNIEGDFFFKRLYFCTVI